MGAEEYQASAERETISESEFRRICEEIYRDRSEIYRFNPGMTHTEALLWMLLGCLISRLSVNDNELQMLEASPDLNTYVDAAVALLHLRRGATTFDARRIIEELAKRAEERVEESCSKSGKRESLHEEG